jgi:hypothetical protein
MGSGPLLLLPLLAALAGPPLPGQASLSPSVPATSARGPFELRTVFPFLAGKNHVRWWEFDWRWIDFHPTAQGAPVRLYFYDREKQVAGLARYFTAEAYREFAERFAYHPSRRIPYLIYNSHFEFQSTNAFFISEHVLGVTSTVDLTMALPYWGEHQRFIHVMRHELAHQFTIQLVRDRSAKARCNPLERYPLWFIEGIAQFYAVGGLNPEVRAALADRLLDRPDGRQGGLNRFFGDGPPTFERIYLIGHAQAVFLEEVGGEGTILRLLEAAPRLCAGERNGRERPELALPFAGLVVREVGLGLEELERRWRDWVLAQMAAQLVARNPIAFFPKVEGIPAGELDSFVVSPDRRTIFFRVFDPRTARARLYLQRLDDPGSRMLVDQDQRPGLVSLHGGGRRVVALGADRLAYIGRIDANDVLFVRRWERKEDGSRVRFELGAPVLHDLWPTHAMIEMGYPALRTDGAVAIVGLSHRTGFLDVYQVERSLEESARVVRLTEDAYAERDLAFGADGTLYFTSDRTPDGSFQLFRMGRTGREQVTHFAGVSEIIDFSVGQDDEILFSAALIDVPQIFRLRDGAIARLTDIPTSLRSPALDASGDVLAVMLEARRSILVRAPKERWIEEPVYPAISDPGPPWHLPLDHAEASIAGAQGYRPYNPRNYRLESGWLQGGTGPFLFGFVMASDTMRDHVVGAQVEVLGAWRRTSAQVLYVNRSGRYGLGGSAFALTGLQLDREQQTGIFLDTYLLQRIGASVRFEYPFGLYTRIEAYAAPHFLRAFDFTNPTSRIAQEESGFQPAIQVGGRFAFDTLRLVPPVGPTGGVSLLLDLAATQRFQGEMPFGQGSLEAAGFVPLSDGQRFYLYTRLGLGSGFGGHLAEQFYLPAVFNIRAFPEGVDELIGGGYYLASAELRVPLDFVIPILSYVEGLAGMDFGNIFFDWRRALSGRVAAAVLGFRLGLGPFVFHLDWARPLDVGGRVPAREWISHFTISAPFLWF